MPRFCTNTPAVLAASILVALSSVDVRAELELKPDASGSVLLMHDGGALSSRPLQFLVQEWRRNEAAASGEKRQEQNTVGSIVEDEPLESGILAPANDAWSDSTQITLSSHPELTQSIRFPGNLGVRAVYTVDPGAVRIAGELRNLAPEGDRAEIPLTLSLAIPIDSQPLTWLADNHRSFPATLTEERIEGVATTAGARGAMSRYPFGGVMNSDIGIAAAMPLDQPRIQRIRWDGPHQALVIEVDVVISGVTAKFPNAVPFSFWVYDFDPEFGFRDLVRRYYDLNPSSYELNVKEFGNWMPFTQVDRVARPEDFHFAYHEYHPNVSVAYNNANDIESLVYCEPPVQYVNVAAGSPQTIDVLLGIIESMDTVQGSQVRTSSTRAADGRMQVAWVETPWAVGARIPTNGDPEIPRTERDKWNSFDANWLPYENLYRKRAADPPAVWRGSGEIVDGVVGATGRALHLMAGQSVSQPLPADSAAPPAFSVRCSGRNGAKLRIRSGHHSGELEPPELMDVVDVDLGDKTDQGNSISLECIDGEVWIDSVKVDDFAIIDPEFARGASDPEQVTGLYLDSFEGWDSKDLNFRREHFATTDYPLTFDARTGQTAQVIMMHNFELAAEARKRLHRRDDILMANTALYQWSWSAHFLDVLGIETSWGEGTRIFPPKIQEMDYLRTMLWQKPYCYLQNVRFDAFRGKKVEDYFARCLHYGFWPSFFSFNAAEEPYWENAELYNADRPYFLRYLRVEDRLAHAGWQPITLAASSDDQLLVERWGGGPWRGSALNAGDLALTVYNPSTRLRSATVRVDPRLLKEADFIALDELHGKRVPYDASGHSFEVELEPLEVTAVRLIALHADDLDSALDGMKDELGFLVDKYRRFGMLDSATAKDYSDLLSSHPKATAWRSMAGGVSTAIEPVYQDEWTRACSLFRTVAAAAEERRSGNTFLPSMPDCIVPFEPFEVTVPDIQPGKALRLVYTVRDTTIEMPFEDGQALPEFPIDLVEGERIRFTIESVDGDSFAPYYESVRQVKPPVSFIGLPDKMVFAKDAEMRLTLRGNSALKGKGRLSASLPDEITPVEDLDLDFAPGQEQDVIIHLVVSEQPDHADARGEAILRWIPGGSESPAAEVAVPLDILPKNASVLRGSDISVRVDSYFFGYDEEPLTDGITDTTGLDWKQAAWASDEGMIPHWVEFALTEPKTLHEVIIYWAMDSGTFWTSQQVRIEGRVSSDDPWHELEVFHGGNRVPSSTITFDPTEIQQLRLYQPAGQGPVDRPGIMWLGEVEAR